MKKLLCIAAALSLAITIGCDRGGTTGGPGATDPSSKKPILGMAENTFTVTTPTLSLSVKPGEAVDATIGIKRGKNFAEDVTITFSELPDGVTPTPDKVRIPADAKDAIVTFKTSTAAIAGDYSIKLLAHPTSGADATNQIKLTIGKKDSFTVSVPLLATSLKQGEAKVVSIGVNRDLKFDQDVSFRFEQLPKGLTIEPASAVVPNGSSEGKFTINAADDAALGDFGIKVIGHPKSGNDIIKDLNVTVTKK